MTIALRPLPGFGRDPLELDRAIHYAVTRAQNRRHVREKLADVRFYRRALESVEVLCSANCREWEESAKAAEEALAEAFALRNEVT